MSMAGPLGIPMDRGGSGTTWIPDAVRLPAREWMTGQWMWMLHGFANVQYDVQGGDRGDSQLGSLNWAMLMGSRDVAGGRLQLRWMPSLDPMTVGKCGYPLLLQSGELCDGTPIVDRQHPHDFFMELAAAYERPINDRIGWSLYVAPAGEPALGPVAFMHRPSAMDEPAAPLGHHWQDATHISFGVVTAGIFTSRMKVEFSAFNGREPNDARWDFDRIRLNSFSGRVTLNPHPEWSLAAGYGALDDPEGTSPGESVRRFTASALHGRALGDVGQWASTLVFGRNQHAGEAASQSVLVESEVLLEDRLTFFGRAEYVEKHAAELDIATLPDEETVSVVNLSLGVVREFWRGRGTTLGIGARGSVGFLPGSAESEYGTRTPMGAMVFVRLRPRMPVRGGHAAH